MNEQKNNEEKMNKTAQNFAREPYLGTYDCRLGIPSQDATMK